MSTAKKMYAMSRLGAPKPAGLDLDRGRGFAPGSPAPTRRGPLPTVATDGRFRAHNACGGRGCEDCTQTGFETLGRKALDAVIAGIVDADQGGDPEQTKTGQLTLF